MGRNQQKHSSKSTLLPTKRCGCPPEPLRFRSTYEKPILIRRNQQRCNGKTESPPTKRCGCPPKPLRFRGTYEKPILISAC
jgi:hypothetical protein